MSSLKRKRQPVPATNDSSSEDSEDDPEEYSSSEDEANKDSLPEDEIEVDFEGHCIRKSDYHGIMRFLQEMLSGMKLDIGQIVEEIISQEGIGSVIKAGSKEGEDEEGQGEGQELLSGENTLGVTTVLMIDQIKNSKLAKQIREVFRNQSEKFGMGIDMAEILSGRIGWLIHERFPGIPSEITPPLLASLKSELASVMVKGKHNMHLVGITRGYHMPRLLKGKRKKSSNISQPSIVYDYSEMEEFVKESKFNFAWPVTETDNKGIHEDDTLDSVRVCFAIDYKKFQSLTKSLQEVHQI